MLDIVVEEGTRTTFYCDRDCHGYLHRCVADTLAEHAAAPELARVVDVLRSGQDPCHDSLHAVARAHAEAIRRSRLLSQYFSNRARGREIQCLALPPGGGGQNDVPGRNQ